MGKAIVQIKFAADLKQFSTKMQSAQRSMNKFGKQMQRVGKQMTIGITAPLTAMGVSAVRTFADFEQGMAKVKAVSGATDKEFQSLTDNAKLLGRSTRYTAKEVSGLQLSYSKLGFSAKEITKVTGATLDLALASGEDLANSATVAASTLRAFNLDASEMNRVVDVMADSFSSSALDLEKFKTAMSTLAPVAKNAGVSLETSTAYLSILTDRGVEASTAGTGLRNMFLELAKQGISLDTALNRINNSSNKNATALALFGKRGATVATIMASNSSEAKELAKQYLNSGGAAKKMAEIMDNTLQGSLFKLKSAFEGMMIEIGTNLKPVIQTFSKHLINLVDKFAALDEGTKKIIVSVAAIAAAAGPLLALAGTILPAIMTGLTLLVSPIGLIAAGLTAVGVIIYKNWEPIKQTLVDIANYFIDLYNESTVFRIAVEAIALQFKNTWAVAKFALGAIWDAIKFLANGIVTRFKLAGAIIKAALTFDADALRAGVDAYEKNTSESFGKLIDNIKKDWNALSTNIADNTTNVINNITQRVKIKLLPNNVDTTAAEEKIVKNLTDAVGRVGTPNASVSNVATDTGMIDGVSTDLATTDPIGAIQNIPFEELEGKMQALQETAQVVGNGVGDAFSNMAGNLVDSLGLADHGFQGFLKGLFKTVTKLISMMLANSMANVIAGATASGTATGPAAVFTTPAFIAEAVAGVVAAFAALPKFATGGIVGGTSYFGDKILAAVNSSELILNTDQQKKLYNMIEPQAQAVQIGLDGSFVLDGQDLRLVLNRVDQFNGRVG